MTSSSIIIGSFNCKNLKSSIGEVKDLCKECDILCLQETWLSETDLHMISQIDSDFYTKSTTAIVMSIIVCIEIFSVSVYDTRGCVTYTIDKDAAHCGRFFIDILLYMYIVIYLQSNALHEILC